MRNGGGVQLKTIRLDQVIITIKLIRIAVRNNDIPATRLTKQRSADPFHSTPIIPNCMKIRLI